MIADAADRERIAANRSALERLESAAERLRSQGALDHAIACSHVAANVAWMNHPGRFASRRLEAVLAGVAADALPTPAGAVPPAPRRRVLHVMSEAYAVGGHTRLAWRWILRDAERRPTLALTRQQGPVPTPLGEAVAGRGGHVVDLRDLEPGLVRRAARLRELAQGHDLVVLHIHPDDPLPSVALAHPGRPPVIVSNHAFHTFWLGRELADAVISPRAVGSRLAAERRGLPPSRCLTVPVPLEDGCPAEDAGAARRALGLPQGATVLLTVAEPFKLRPLGGRHLLDAVEPVLERHPDAVLVMVGPEDEQPWSSARERTGGRVLAAGRRPDVHRFYAAADIFLESYPCSSLTAVREAATYGLPVVTFAPDPVEADMLGSSDEPLGPRAGTPAEYLEAVSALIVDRDARAGWASHAREAGGAAEDPDRWLEQLEAAYRRAGELGTLGQADLAVPQEAFAPEDVVVERLHHFGGRSHAPGDIARAGAALEVAALDPILHRCLPPAALIGPLPRTLRPYQTALAAPPPDAGAVAAAVDAMRRLAGAGAAERSVVTVPEAELEITVPLIEAALAAEGDLDLDLIVTDDPQAVALDGALLVTVPGDRLAGLDERLPRLAACVPDPAGAPA